MRGIRFLSCFFCALLIGLALPLAVGAEGGFRAELSAAEGREGDSVELTLSCPAGEDPVGAAFFQIDYDPGLFEYRDLRQSAGFREGVTVTVTDEGRIAFGYAYPAEAAPLTAADTVTCRFRVRAGAPQSAGTFSATVYGVCGLSGEALPGLEQTLAYQVLPPLSSQAELLSLAPSAGILTPDFSPEICDYQVTVPFSVTVLTFYAEPAAGAVCRVNRRNLGAGGSDTEFLVTVTAEDRQARTVYRVTAHREEREVSPKPSATPRPAATPKPTATPKRTASPRPTATPRPTAAPQPSATPKSGAAAPTAAATLPSVTPSPEPRGVPVPVGTVEEPSPPPPDREPAALQAPVLELRSGGAAEGVPWWSLALLTAALLLSRPLAGGIAALADRHGAKRPPEQKK